MKTYNFYIDRKYEIWKRDYVKVEADKLGEAINKAKSGDYEELSSNFLVDTITDPPEGPVIEIYSNEPLFSSI